MKVFLEGLGQTYTTPEEAQIELNFLQILLSSKKTDLITAQNWIDGFKVFCNNISIIYKYYGEFAQGQTINFETDIFPSFADPYLSAEGKIKLTDYLAKVESYKDFYHPAVIALQADINTITQLINGIQYFIADYVPETVPVVEPVIITEPGAILTPESILAVEPVVPAVPETPVLEPAVDIPPADLPVSPEEFSSPEVEPESGIVSAMSVVPADPAETTAVVPVPDTAVTAPATTKNKYLPLIIGAGILSLLYLLKNKKRYA